MSVHTRRASLGMLTAAVVAVAVLVPAAPSHASSGDLGWATTMTAIDISGGTGNYTPRLGCVAKNCTSRSTTVLTVTALAGATFTDLGGHGHRLGVRGQRELG